MSDNLHGLVGLSFDLASLSGVVRWHGRTPEDAHLLRLPKSGRGHQFAHWDAHLQTLLAAHTPDWIAYEDARAMSKPHGEILFGLTAILLMHAYQRDITTLPFTQSQVKKALTGKGNADKAAMIACAQARYPDLCITDDNEADALGVGLAFLGTQRG